MKPFDSAWILLKQFNNHFTNKEELRQRRLERAKKESFLRQQAAYIEALKNKGTMEGDDELYHLESQDDQRRREGLPTTFERLIGPNEDFGIPQEILEEYRNKLAFENRFSNNNPYGQNADDIVDDYYRQQEM